MFRLGKIWKAMDTMLETMLRCIQMQIYHDGVWQLALGEIRLLESGLSM